MLRRPAGLLLSNGNPALLRDCGTLRKTGETPAFVEVGAGEAGTDTVGVEGEEFGIGLVSSDVTVLFPVTVVGSLLVLVLVAGVLGVADLSVSLLADDDGGDGVSTGAVAVAEVTEDSSMSASFVSEDGVDSVVSTGVVVEGGVAEEDAVSVSFAVDDSPVSSWFVAEGDGDVAVSTELSAVAGVLEDDSMSISFGELDAGDAAVSTGEESSLAAVADGSAESILFEVEDGDDVSISTGTVAAVAVGDDVGGAVSVSSLAADVGEVDGGGVDGCVEELPTISEEFIKLETFLLSADDEGDCSESSMSFCFFSGGCFTESASVSLRSGPSLEGLLLSTLSFLSSSSLRAGRFFEGDKGGQGGASDVFSSGCDAEGEEEAGATSCLVTVAPSLLRAVFCSWRSVSSAHCTPTTGSQALSGVELSVAVFVLGASSPSLSTFCGVSGSFMGSSSLLFSLFSFVVSTASAITTSRWSVSCSTRGGSTTGGGSAMVGSEAGGAFAAAGASRVGVASGAGGASAVEGLSVTEGVVVAARGASAAKSASAIKGESLGFFSEGSSVCIAGDCWCSASPRLCVSACRTEEKGCRPAQGW